MNLYRHIAERSELEREYSPSSCAADWRSILDAYVARSQAARAARPDFASLQYGPEADEVLDIFLPHKRSGPVPVLLYIHGGYWQELSKDEHAFPALDVNANDIAYVAANYGLAPRVTLDRMIDRCRKAVAWLWREGGAFGLDVSAIHLAGCSAGAHLAAMTALAEWDAYGIDRSPIGSITLLSGVFDLRPIPLTYINDALGMSAAQAVQWSPLVLIDAFQGALPQTLIVHGDNEPSEFKRQSLEFAQALKRKGAKVDQHEIAGRNHFDLIFDLADARTQLGALTLRHLQSAHQG